MRRRKKFASGSIVVATPTATSGGGGAVTPDLVVEYVDTSGALQTTTVVNGVTSISGVAPFLVHFDASGSRSTAADADDEAGAWHYLGYRLNYGEALGTSWTYPAGSGDWAPASKDEDVGPPIFGHVYTATGTFSTRLKVKDSGGAESTISLTVVVSAPPTATNIPVANGAWPTWASLTHYTLDAGGDYSSFGRINTQGKHNILISKTGSGADPIVGTFVPDGRGVTGTAITDRASNIRLLDIDVAAMGQDGALVGGRYYGVIRGRCRKLDESKAWYYYANSTTTNTQRNNITFPRGVFIWDCAGELNVDTDGGQYVMYEGTGLRRFHIAGVQLHKNGVANNHLARMVLEQSTMRHCNLWSTVGIVTYWKQQSNGNVTWPSGDGIGSGSAGSAYLVETYKNVSHSNQFGRSGSTTPQGGYSVAPQDNSSPTERHRYNAFERNVSYGSTIASNTNGMDAGGVELSCRGNRCSLGTGNWMVMNQGEFGPNEDGPYVYEAANTRPVPSSF